MALKDDTAEYMVGGERYRVYRIYLDTIPATDESTWAADHFENAQWVRVGTWHGLATDAITVARDALVGTPD